MTSIKLDFNGIDKVRKFTVNFPKKLDFNLSKTNSKFIDDVIALAKKYAPRDTDSLIEDIKKVPVRKGKNVKIWKVRVDNPAGAPQEFGFEAHWAPIINSSKIPPGVYFVSRNTPFLKPALEQNLSGYSQKLNKAVRGAIIR